MQRQAEQGQNTGQEQSKQGKQVRFDEEEQLEEMRTENAEVVMDGVEEVRSGRGRVGLVRGGRRQILGGRDKERQRKG